MQAHKLFLLVGGLIGLVVGSISMLLLFAWFSEADTASVGLLTNVVVAAGAVFSLGFSLWQHQQTINDGRRKAQPMLRLVGAPVRQLPAKNAVQPVQAELQIRNDGGGPASNIRVRTFGAPLNSPALLQCSLDKRMANALFPGEGLHHHVGATFLTNVPPEQAEMFFFVRIDFEDAVQDQGPLFTENYLKINWADPALANATTEDAERFQHKIKELVR